MSNILVLNQPQVAVGVPPSFTYTVTAAGNYNAQVQATVPFAYGSGDGAGSGGVASNGQNPNITSSLSIVVQQNGTTVYTSPSISGQQSLVKFKTPLVCAVNDVITVVPSSSNPNDTALNSIQMECTIAQGFN